MKKTLCIVVAIVLLSTFLGGCVYDIDPETLLGLMAVPYNILEGGLDADPGLSCAEQGFFLIAGNGYGEIDAHYYYRWYRDGEPLGPRSDEWFMDRAVFYPPLAEDLDLEDPEFPGPLFTPGTYAIEFFEGPETTEVLLRLSVVVPSCSCSRRADVSVTVYGGWDGIPVQAWVGGTEQETLYTAHDASGEAAVLWTLYPPAGEAFNVSVAPQTPPGKDPARWQYRLVRIEGPTPGEVNNEPKSADVPVSAGSQYRLYFQLLDMGPGQASSRAGTNRVECKGASLLGRPGYQGRAPSRFTFSPAGAIPLGA